MPPAELDGPTVVAVRTEPRRPSLGTSAAGLYETTITSDGLPSPSPATPLRRGEVLGRYVVLDVLGHGGMGVVYAAYDPELDRKVAIKLVRWESGADDQASIGRSRLLREAQALAKLTHSNVVAVYDVGTWQQAVFVAMELVEGQTLARFLAQRHAESPPSWREVLDVMIPAGRGLEAAHAVGIVHRDFKPDNVMLGRSGRVIVLDFGLARATEGVAAEPRMHTTGGRLPGSSGAMSLQLTAEGSVMGTPAYMAPEQLMGKVSDAASDQFAFCVTLYYALYGMRPFAGETFPALTQAVLQGAIEPAPRGSRVPAWLRRVVTRGLQRDAEQRYASMTELLAALSHDPARRRGRVLLGGGVAALLAGSWWGARLVASGEDPCASIDGAMAEAWGPSRRAELEQAFRRDAKTYSEPTLARVAASLDGWAGQWVDERRAACEAGREAGTEAARDAGLQTACLDERLARLDALVRLLGDADQAMVAKALFAVQSLPEPAGCRDAEGWRRSAPLPDDPAMREAVESLRLRMSEVHARSSTGRVQDAATQAEALLTEARALGYPPAVAQMLFAVGGTKTMVGDYAGALPLLEEALLLARAHGLEKLESDVLSPLVFLHTSYTGKLDLAEWHSRVHEVLVERLGGPPRTKAKALVDRARLERHRDRTDEAIALYERAAALYEEDGGDSPGLVVAYDNLASSYIAADRYDEAVRVIARAEAVAAASLGPDHPHRGNLMVQAARIAAAKGDHAKAVAQLRAALALYEGAYGGQHANIAAVLNGLALELEALGEPVEALAAYERAVEVGERTLGAEHREIAVVQANLANLLRRSGRAQEALALHQRIRALRERLGMDATARFHVMENLADDLRVLGRCEEAEAEYRAALALRETANEHTGPGAAYPYLGLGLCERQRGKRAAAVASLETALRFAVAVEAKPTGKGEDEDEDEDEEEADWNRRTLALTRLALAMVLRQDEPGSARALALAEQALAFWAADPAQHAPLLRQHGAWAAGGPPTMLVY